MQSRTLLVNTARSLAKGFGLRLPASITHTFGARALAGLAEHLHQAMRGLLEQIDALGAKIRGNYDERVKEVAGRGIPEGGTAGRRSGCGERLTATAFVLTLGRKGTIRAQSRCLRQFCWGCVRGDGNQASVIPQLGISGRAAINICASCWCSARIACWGIGAKNSALRQWGLSKSGGSAEQETGGRGGGAEAGRAAARECGRPGKTSNLFLRWCDCFVAIVMLRKP